MWRGEAVAVVEQAQAVVHHSYIVDKNQEGYLGREQSQPQARPHSPGFQHQEDKSPKLLAVKIIGGWGSGRNCWIFRKLCLKGPHGLKTYTNPPTLGFNTRAIARRALVTYGEWVK